VNDDNVIGLIFKFAIIMIVFLYLVFKMQTDKNTGANNVYNS
jgi:preprotein translocase subunit YajC